MGRSMGEGLIYLSAWTAGSLPCVAFVGWGYGESCSSSSNGLKRRVFLDVAAAH